MESVGKDIFCHIIRDLRPKDCVSQDETKKRPYNSLHWQDSVRPDAFASRGLPGITLRKVAIPEDSCSIPMPVLCFLLYNMIGFKRMKPS